MEWFTSKSGCRYCSRLWDYGLKFRRSACWSWGTGLQVPENRDRLGGWKTMDLGVVYEGGVRCSQKGNTTN